MTVAAVVTSTAAVVVIVPGAESLTGGRPALVLQGIAGVSAVPGRCQLILTCLVTDGERRVFSRVPQAGITQDLHSTDVYGLIIMQRSPVAAPVRSRYLYIIMARDLPLCAHAIRGPPVRGLTEEEDFQTEEGTSSCSSLVTDTRRRKLVV